jgi:hypothetical protein
VINLLLERPYVDAMVTEVISFSEFFSVIRTNRVCIQFSSSSSSGVSGFFWLLLDCILLIDKLSLI